MRTRTLIRLAVVSALIGASAGFCAEEPLNPPTPLLRTAAGASAGTEAMTHTAAELTRELGFSSEAAGFYRQLLAQPGADRVNLTLALATALLEANRSEEAEKALATLPEPRSAGWYLRAGLAALQQRKYDGVRAILGPPNLIKEAELPVSDYPWYWFLQGAYVDLFSPNEVSRANDFYVRAETAAPNELARARFKLAGDEVRLRRESTPSRDALKTMKDNADRLQGTEIGYNWAKLYALGLWAADQRSEAITYLQTVLPLVPVRVTPWWDDLRLLAGLIGDRGRGVLGRKALTELLESGTNPERQRQALQLLMEASQTEPARRELRVALERMSGPNSKHRILESLLFYRAQLALVDKKYDEAAIRAGEMLEKFPATPLRVHAFSLLAQLAWEQRRFRLVAENARKARAALAEAKQPRELAARAELTLVEAEALFRAGQAAGDKNDFRSAADAYAAALRERPANVKPGDLMFQRVLAEIKAESPNASKVLDEIENDPAFDLENRWQAEWSLARALLVQDKSAEAYARVTNLLALPTAGVKPELRARMAWLQVKLSLEAKQPLQTLTLVDALVSTLGELEPALRAEIASTALLRKATAEFQLGREPLALATLQKVRVDYPTSEAAITSFLVEADHYADSDRIQDAQKTLTALTENAAYKDSVLIPFAYYQLAVLSERLGQAKDLDEAWRRIEDLINLPAASAQGELVFLARMKQGELLRKKNQFAQAQRVYDLLMTLPASTENWIHARLELAKTHNAQGANDNAHADSAQLMFTELCERVDASPDVRVEAGYLLGALLVRRGKAEEAAQVWWRDVITPFLPTKAKPIEFGATRLYWLARTLFEVGELYEQLGQFENAKGAYSLIVTHRLEGEVSAKKKLEQLGVLANRPGSL